MAYHEIDGALFRDAPVNDGKRHPVMHLALEVLGVKMQVAVWPSEKSAAKGIQYWPVSGSYARNETKRLVQVNVEGMRIHYSNATAAVPADGQATEPQGGADDCPL